jgi:hypothetical protein
MSTKDEASSSGWRAGRTAERYGDTERVHRGSPPIVYEFAQVDKLLQAGKFMWLRNDSSMRTPHAGSRLSPTTSGVRPSSSQPLPDPPLWQRGAVAARVVAWPPQRLHRGQGHRANSCPHIPGPGWAPSGIEGPQQRVQEDLASARGSPSI